MRPVSARRLTLVTTLALVVTVRAVILPDSSSQSRINHPRPIKLQTPDVPQTLSTSRIRRSPSEAISLQNTFPDVLDENAEQSELDGYPEAGVEVKRRWNSGRSMAVWGKRDATDDMMDKEKRKWSGDRKMALWGKRYSDDVADLKSKIRNDQAMPALGELDSDHSNMQKRKWRNGNRMELWGKRKWLSRNMAVWGKRGFDEGSDAEKDVGDKRSWRGRDMAVWG